ncbi:ATP-binding cassette sub-family A member 13 [Stomoxys calcitrans]|uniref:ATP-binding cassette sub-family A member 13 n=1 Tax=Stomoxys calcitrans TaxID=35570 RepID=UPI0027E3A709|nr:ATP-binding cassette sub-family A member 13 [Stomoxys calcitrans]XP_059222780.1 ATP-binding cassette sub-family A member 13 [Stomoxys calcitrans]
MKFLKANISWSQIQAILRKDFLVRWRQKWLMALQILWPLVIFLLPYLIRLKFTPVHKDSCQFPTRQLPTARQTLPGMLSYICTLENKCKSTDTYDEYEFLPKSPVKPVVDVVQILINDDGLFKILVELPEKANFISAVTTLVTNSHFGEIRENIGKVVDMIPEVRKTLNGTFDIKTLFSNRKTFVKAGNLICGYPFPSIDTIPLVSDILESQDFSKVNDDEINAMPTPYCKKLYLDVTRSNYGKITWESVKPIIQGKILFAPNNADTNSIMALSNTTFQEINRLKQLSVAFEQILLKLKTPGDFQNGFNALIELAKTPFVRSVIGDEIDLDQMEAVIERIRTDPVIEDVVVTIRKLLECFSADRFLAFDSEEELRRQAFEMNHKRMFYAAIYFNDTQSDNVAYKLHMDTQNTQPTIENKNRFWFPGPSGSMLLDLKYHRGFVQIKHSLDLGIIRHKKEKLREQGLLEPPTTPKPPGPLFTVHIETGDDEEDDEDDDDEWSTNSNSTTAVLGSTKPKNQTLISSVVSGIGIDVGNVTKKPLVSVTETTPMTPSDDETTNMPELDEEATTDLPLEATTESIDNEIITTLLPQLSDELLDNLENGEILKRQKRQGFADLFSSFSSQVEETYKFEIDKLKYFTKQFPYPAYTKDDFKTGIYLAQAIQLAFFIGLVAEIASSVRHLIWMRESKNSMIMRAMGLKSCSEMTSWCLVTFLELLVIFIMVSIVLYTGGMIVYTKWVFTMIYLCAFGACLISFCYMCSTFFVTATIGAVATTVLFFITFCPYIIVLIFDSKLNSLQNFLINLSFTTAYAHGWSHIMRMELQEVGLSFEAAFREGLRGEYGFAFFMIILDTIIYAVIGYIHQRFKDDDNRFVEVQREELDTSVGATLTNVTKVYNETKYAVTDISLSFPRDKVTCLLGRNGAGKSTIIKMLTGQVVQSTGRVILSQAMSSGKEYDKVGVCSQDNILIPNLTAREHLELYAKIKLKRNYESEVQKTLKDLNFGKHENYQASQLSGGYKRRLCVAISFIASPNVVILDEPCNGVDNKARKDIWDLIERLRKGRAVIFATHFLDEAEYLSDVIVIMKNGKIIAKHNPETLKNHCTSFYEVSMNSCDSQTSNMIVDKANKLLTNYRQLDKTSSTDLSLRISYDQPNYNSSEYLSYLQELQGEGRIKDLGIESENLEQVFKNLDKHAANGTTNGHVMGNDLLKNAKLKRELGWDMVSEKNLHRCTAMRQLFWKRLVHFSRNYRMLLCVIVLPALFEICAMWFVAQRLEDDFDKTIKLSRQLYPKTTQMLSMEKSLAFTQDVYSNMKQDCAAGADLTCKEFPNTEKSFYWILKSLNEYQEKRYGGYTFNESKSMVWYNNKGYHAMVAWLNDMNSYLMQVETNNTNFKITSYNEPWELGFLELSTTSILRQAGDSCLAFILLIAFSMVVAVASVYLVNERVKGEKLQQRLCGVDAATYWGVAFIWDFLILIIGIFVCCSVILAFDMPVFTDLQQLWGVIVLALFFGFACIPGVHVFEKCFNDSSVAIVGIFIINIIIPLFTLSTIVLLGVVGDTPAWDEWRHFLNHRLFIIFPQHALGDGLLELCKNYMVSLTFRRYGIDSYKNPVNSDLLQVHFTSLGVVGIFFLVLNVLLESGLLGDWKEKIMQHLGSSKHKHLEELKVISIQNSLKRNDKDDLYALKVDNLSKTYGNGQYAVSNVTFTVKSGECFGLLGKNGAGKSTIFKMLSGQLRPSAGHIIYDNPEISYCPQTNTLDDLLTVRECIEFYGKLRRINDLPKLVAGILESFQLESYRDVLVKNLSGGNRRKLTVATACCGRTSVVLMDEPTSDMDPVTRAIVYRTIDDLLAEKRAIVLTSHSISEIDLICHRIAVLKDGQMLTCSSPESLKAQFGGYYNVTVYCDQNKLRDLEKEILRQFPFAKDLQVHAHSIKFSIKVENPTNVNGKQKENGIDLPEELKKAENDSQTTSPSKESLTLSQLFHDLSALPQHVSSSLRYAVNRCKLDAVFERILDRSEQSNLRRGSFYNDSDVAAIGSPSTGYIHNGYVETET